MDGSSVAHGAAAGGALLDRMGLGAATGLRTGVTESACPARPGAARFDDGATLSATAREAV